jgi:hypothetical protein
MDDTLSAYSTFCTNNCPNEYETRMVQCSKASQGAKTKWSGEKRFHKTREDLESAIDYTFYIDWELDVKSKNRDESLIRGIFERAVAAAAEAAGGNAEYKYFEAGLWERYIAWSGNDARVLRRAVRACPGTGVLWAKCMYEEVSVGLSPMIVMI